MSAGGPKGHRRPYLDWLRGIGVLIMIEGHALDSWTRVADRDTDAYRYAILVAGFGAPLFLFLAGVAVVLAAGSRLRRGLDMRAVVVAALRRGGWILLLAFLFRLQSMVISGGSFPRSLLKVDILNVMGVSMIAAALLWGLGRSGPARLAIFGAATAVLAMATPLVRNAAWPGALPDPLEWYLRPAAGSTTFTLVPWMGFLTAGAAIGVALDAVREAAAERRLAVWLAAAGVTTAMSGYAASFLPPLYDNASFWSSSPTFFFVRLGVVIASVPLALAATRLWPGAALQEFGRASLFVYWIHVEMAYGVISLPLHRRLPFGIALVALVVFGALLFALVRLKARFTGQGRSPQPSVRKDVQFREVRRETG